MLGVKVPLKDAEKIKAYLSHNDYFNQDYRYFKDKTHIYFPIKDDKNNFDLSDITLSASFVDVKFDKSVIKGSLKDNLSKILSEKELSFVKTAHDVIGTIAILEIPKDLVKRERVIAETLLKINSNIKTILKKADIHGGLFRTQKMKHLAGIKTKETIYKENNVLMKLDVEKVYFSIRLSNERKRLADIIMPNEEVLVMFSGCAPYPLVLAKNTKAKHITGVEVNPIGHKYGLENLKLNNIHNVTLVNDDVKKFSNNVYQKIIGLKCALKPADLNLRLKKKPSIMEIHLFDDDFDDKKINKTLSNLEKYVKLLRSRGIEPYIHMPMMHNGKNYTLDTQEGIDLCKKVGELCRKHGASAIVHLNSKDKVESNEYSIIAKVKDLKNYYDYFYFENLVKTMRNKESMMKIGKEAGFKNMCIDLTHLYIVYEDNKKIISTIEEIKKNFNTYFHVSDHNKKIHTTELGKGFIDLKNILPLVTKGIIEVQSKNELKPKESITSYDKLKKYQKLNGKKYDRIIMPAPHDAHKFLDDALRLAQKGTIIHYYDFLELDKFDTAVKKITAVCKKRKMKFEVLDIVKCGQHAPYVYRICVDFKIV